MLLRAGNACKSPEYNILAALLFRIKILQPRGEGGAGTVLDCFAMSVEESGNPEFRLLPPGFSSVPHQYPAREAKERLFRANVAG
jgi:hypothetical protein